MKIFSATYGDFVKFDVKPNEDALLVSKKLPVFAVADGVTQSHYPNGRYALPYGAKEAARLFCRAVIGHFEKHWEVKDATAKAVQNHIRQSFDLANAKIQKLNFKHGIQKRMDYTMHDWFDTVGIMAVITGNKLHYGLVGDCGLIIFDKNNKKKFQTKDMVRPAVKRFNKQYPDAKSWHPLQRQFVIRKDFRNNPNKRGYGSFTGQPGVENYYAFGAVSLAKGDMVILYSDGFFPYVTDKRFIEIARLGNKKALNALVQEKAIQDPDKYGDDRTLVTITL